MPATPLQRQHEAAGARFAEQAGWPMPADFGDPVAEHIKCRESAILMDLSHRGKLRIAGADAFRFLHGMLSNHVQDLAPGEGVYTTFLTRQGKLVADLYLYRRESDLLANLAPGTAQPFAEAMDRFIIMDQVEIEDRTEAYGCLGVFGLRSREALSAAGLEAPELPEHGHFERAGVHVARELWTGEDGYLLTVPAGETAPLWRRLAEAGAAPAGLRAFESLTLEAGVPLFGRDMDADVNPMQAGLETKAIDFEKGCYIGQEVIAKIKYLGQVNRGLVGLRLQTEIPPPAGAAVFLGDREVGTLTRAAFCPTAGGVLAFGYLHRDAMSPGTRIEIRGGALQVAGRVTELPFHRRPAPAAS